MSALLLIAVVFELLCTTLLIKLDFRSSSVLYFICGLVIAFLPMFRARFSSNLLIHNKIKKGFFFSIVGYLIYLLIKGAQKVFSSVPVDYQIADMLPIMKIMCERLINGKEVYAVIPEIWGGMYPIYLPAMWLPFLPSTLLDIDPRWTCIGALIVGIIAILLMSKNTKPFTVSALLLIPLSIIPRGLIEGDHRFLSMTEESIVVCYYLLLALALIRKNPIFIGITLALCMLSRYSLAIWAVLYVLYVFFYEDKRKGIYIAAAGTITGLLLMIPSQAIFHLDTFLGLQSNYIEAVINQRPKYEPVINESLGWAKFYAYENLSSLHRLFLITAIAVPLTCFLLFIKFKNKVNQDFFVLCSLKLTLVFFYNLLVMPYIYLFYTSTFLSIGILHYYLTYNFDDSRVSTESVTEDPVLYDV